MRVRSSARRDMVPRRTTTLVLQTRSALDESRKLLPLIIHSLCEMDESMEAKRQRRDGENLGWLAVSTTSALRPCAGVCLCAYL